MPNLFAYVVLFSWPIVAYLLYTRMPIERALIWSIIAPYLLLPPGAEFDAPLIPALDKTSLPNLMAFLGCVVIAGQRVPLFPANWIGRILVVLFVASPFATILTNQQAFVSDIIFEGEYVLKPGQRLHDAFSAIANQAIFILPFFLARKILATEAALTEMLRIFVIAALIYTIPILIEIRLSPQMNTWVYGFHQHSFQQAIRGGGFRPLVFLPHGLWLAMFLLMTIIASATMWRYSKDDRRNMYALCTGCLFLLLVLCKSLGALVYALAVVPIALMATPKTQIWAAVGLATIALTYPLLRGADLVPVDSLLDFARSISAERAQSLEFRFVNEQLLLDHAAEKPWFGWGLWGRSSAFNIETYKEAVKDGRWIIVIGVYGWLGYIVEFGLLSLPLFLLAFRFGAAKIENLPPHAGPLALMLGINLIDLLPNATLVPMTWLIAGTLLGFVEAQKPVRRAGPKAIGVQLGHADEDDEEAHAMAAVDQSRGTLSGSTLAPSTHRAPHKTKTLI